MEAAKFFLTYSDSVLLDFTAGVTEESLLQVMKMRITLK